MKYSMTDKIAAVAIAIFMLCGLVQCVANGNPRGGYSDMWRL